MSCCVFVYVDGCVLCMRVVAAVQWLDCFIFPRQNFLLSFRFSYSVVYFNYSQLSVTAMNQIIFIPIYLPKQPGVYPLSEGSLTNTAKLAAGILFSPQFLYRMTGKIFVQAF